MFRKFRNKSNKNEGSMALGFVIITPVMLLILFLMVDYLHISSDKASLQRRVDSAVLGIVANAAPEGDVQVDLNGYITSGPNSGSKVCAITEEMMEHGIEQLKKDAYDVGIELDGVVNLSDEEQMKSGVASILAKGYSDDLMLDALIDGGVRFSFVVEGYASCSVTAKD